jgi:hypothetical protein
MEPFVDENPSAGRRCGKSAHKQRRYKREHAARETRLKNRTGTFGMSQFHCLRSLMHRFVSGDILPFWANIVYTLNHRSATF